MVRCILVVHARSTVVGACPLVHHIQDLRRLRLLWLLLPARLRMRVRVGQSNR